MRKLQDQKYNALPPNVGHMGAGGPISNLDVVVDAIEIKADPEYGIPENVEYKRLDYIKKRLYPHHKVG